MTVSHLVTPTLVVGASPRVSGAVEVSTVEEAVRVIEARGVAVLPEDAWQTAREVLERLGLSDEMIKDRLHFAQTGRILGPVSPALPVAQESLGPGAAGLTP